TDVRARRRSPAAGVLLDLVRVAARARCRDRLPARLRNRGHSRARAPARRSADRRSRSDRRRCRDAEGARPPRRDRLRESSRQPRRGPCARAARGRHRGKRTAGPRSVRGAPLQRRVGRAARGHGARARGGRETVTERTRVDPITLAVIRGALTSAVAEMSVVVERTARSPIIAISHDYSNALYVQLEDGPQMVVQGQDQPCHLGGMLASVKNAALRFADGLAPGDVIVGNEPDLNGTHLLDVDLIQPIFAGDRLIGWACSRAHEIDIGGPVAGGYNPHAEDIYGEGLVIPPIKLVEAGRTREDV